MSIYELYHTVIPIYDLALLLLIGLVLEALAKYKRQTWSLPALVIYATTFVWYFVEFIYTPENLAVFSEAIIRTSFLQVIMFLVSFRIVIPIFTRRFLPQTQPKSSSTNWNPKSLLILISIIWGLLLCFGIIRMNGNILGALFPIQSRAGVHMWARAAGEGAGATGFIISSASYIYLLTCSFFGVLLFFQTNNKAKIANLLLLLAAIPYYFLLGARNQLLVVLMPGYFSYILFTPQKPWIKVIITIIGFFILNELFTIIITYRNIGFTTLFRPENFALANVSEQQHLGLNMFEELCHINSFIQQQRISLSYGGGYVAELLNAVPRAVWPNKPLLNVDYAIERGFGGSNSDIGVVATISSGFIGQGILNFGAWYGAIAPSIFFSAWATWLSCLWKQNNSTLRKCLFLTALGITFNLGRDITLLVLFPIVFGYILVRFLENKDIKKKKTRVSV